MRHLVPELLDLLPPENPRAIQSRQDLQRLNRLMRNHKLLADVLRSAFADSPPDRMIEIGAGDGTFLLQVARILSTFWTRVNVVLLDQQKLVRPETLEAFSRLGWPAESITSNVFDWLDQTPGPLVDVMIANLFLHHFSNDHLVRLLVQASRRCRFFVACEPRRSSFPRVCSRLIWLVGCNDVTRHDAVASVRAGFVGSELSELWPERSKWWLYEGTAGLFGHLFFASCFSIKLPKRI